MRGSDFNYKVALASGLKSLQAGQLGKAEEQFRYLREKFPHADGGYRGLAKVAIERSDPATALAALRDGAAALAKAGERQAAIGLLREIITLDAIDHGAHRRLAAALILAGDRDAAIEEYRRYARLVTPTPGGQDRARLELAYAREQLGETLEGAPPPGEAGRGEVAAAAAAPAPGAPAVTAAAAGPDLQARAERAIAEHDALAAAVVLDAARAHLADGLTMAATDLLLAAVASGFATRETQRLLVAAATVAGAHDIARERAALLARVEALGG